MFSPDRQGFFPALWVQFVQELGEGDNDQLDDTGDGMVQQGEVDGMETGDEYWDREEQHPALVEHANNQLRWGREGRNLEETNIDIFFKVLADKNTTKCWHKIVLHILNFDYYPKSKHILTIKFDYECKIKSTISKY